jgi:hypothetical protein
MRAKAKVPLTAATVWKPGEGEGEDRSAFEGRGREGRQEERKGEEGRADLMGFGRLRSTGSDGTDAGAEDERSERERLRWAYVRVQERLRQ